MALFTNVSKSTITVTDSTGLVSTVAPGAEFSSPTQTSSIDLLIADGFIRTGSKYLWAKEITAGIGNTDKVDTLLAKMHNSLTGALSVSYFTPTTGTSIPLTNTNTFAPFPVQTYIFNPAGTIAALTVVTPGFPEDGQEIVMASTQIVTTLTITATATPAGTPTIYGGLAAFTAGGYFKLKYSVAGNLWIRVG